MSDYLKDNNLAELDHRTEIIVSGYTKQMQPFLFLQIPSEIVTITLLFVHDHFMLHRGWYEWHIDSELLQTMLTANNRTKFVSPTFQIAGLNWKLDAYPNGVDNNNIGAFNLYPNLLSMPSSWKSIMTNYRLYCDETRTGHSQISTYDHAGAGRGLPGDCLLLQDIQHLNTNKLTLLVYIQILRIDLIENDKILYQYPLKYDTKKIQKFEWRIDKALMNEMKNARHNKGYLSPLFHDMWCFQVYPNGRRNNNDHVYLQFILCTLPMDLTKITVNWKVICDEMDTVSNHRNMFDSEDNNNWYYDILSTDDFRKFDTFTFRIEISAGESDEDDLFARTQWKQYVENMRKEEDKEMDTVMTEIDKVKQENIKLSAKYITLEQQLHVLTAKIEEMIEKANVAENGLVEGINYTTDENGADEVNEWLDSMGFNMYFDLFIKNGFDSLEMIKEINNENDLNNIGVTLKAHQLKLMNHIKTLKH